MLDFAIILAAQAAFGEVRVCVWGALGWAKEDPRIVEIVLWCI